MAATVTFIDRNFNDTLAMIIEARHYIAYGPIPDRGTVAPTLQLQIGYEAMRVTARLLSTMAWLLTAQSIRNGAERQDNDIGLATTEACLDPSGPDNESLPKGLRSLLDRSYRLYMRVSRLEAQSRQCA